MIVVKRNVGIAITESYDVIHGTCDVAPQVFFIAYYTTVDLFFVYIDEIACHVRIDYIPEDFHFAIDFNVW